jgi:beta-lactamase class A
MIKRIIAGCLMLFITFISLDTRAHNLNKIIKEYESDLNAKIAVSIYDMNKKNIWSYRKNYPMPIMSTFKTLACANVLYKVDRGLINLDKEIIIKQSDILKDSWSPVLKGKAGQIMSIKQLCDAMMMQSDNSAANIILKEIGGPKKLTMFIRSQGYRKTNLTRYEPYLNNVKKGSKNDTTTSREMVRILKKLLYDKKPLSKSSREQLLTWLEQNQVSGNLLRSIVPQSYFIADRTGGAKGARAINAIVWNQKNKPIIISIYISQSNANMRKLNDTIISIGKYIFEKYKVK